MSVPFGSKKGCVRSIDDPADFLSLVNSGLIWRTVMFVSWKQKAIDEIASGKIVETDLIRSHYPAGLAEHIEDLRAAKRLSEVRWQDVRWPVRLDRYG